MVWLKAQFRVFGCAAYAHILDCNWRKLDGKAELRFVGYSKYPRGYRLYDECTNKVVTRRDVIFDESNFLLSSGAHQSNEGLEVLLPSESPEIATEQDETQEAGNEAPEQQVCWSGRAHNPPERLGSWVSYTANCEHFAYNVCQVPELKTIDEALSGPHAKEWKQTAESEYQSLMDNDSWDLVELPEGRETIGSKWVFKVKHDSCGQVERFKGRVVAKGYSQKHGIDFEETFAPVLRFSSIWTLLAFAVNTSMIIHQMDVVTAFLNGELKEEIYMQQPPGYEVPD